MRAGPENLTNQEAPMSAFELLHIQLSNALPNMHLTRLTALCTAVVAGLSGAQMCITELGRFLTSSTHIKHNIKRMDRLMGNAHLYRERQTIYGAMARAILKNIAKPIITIDWSDLCPNQQFHVIRASLPVGGRALTIFEIVYPREKLGNRQVQHDFLNSLQAFLTPDQTPIIVADSGFRVPFFRHVESLGWHWVGRIRNRDYVCFSQENGYISAKSLYAQATAEASHLGAVSWTQTGQLAALLALIKTPKKFRELKTKQNQKSQAGHSKKQALREDEPWLLVFSNSLQDHSAQQIIKIYSTRMQIEENFRDTKSQHYGLGICQLNRIGLLRRSNLLLIAALTQWLLWLTGSLLHEGVMEKQFRVNSSSKRKPYSSVFLARQLLKLGLLLPDFLSPARFIDAMEKIHGYQNKVFSG